MSRSKVEYTYKEDASKGQEIETLCESCSGATYHVVRASFKSYAEQEIDYRNSVSWSDDFQVIQCLGCKTISFRKNHWFSEDAWADEDGTSEVLFPKRNPLPSKHFANAPGNVQVIYDEVVNSYNNDNPILCAAGLRAVVEGICADKGVKDGPVEVKVGDAIRIERRKNLEGKISGLLEKRLITEASEGMLHSHRFLGNEAIHDLEAPSNIELKLAIEIIEHILEHLYEIPDKAKELGRRREARIPKPE